MTPPSIRAQMAQGPDPGMVMRMGQQARQPVGPGSEQISLLAQKMDQFEALVGEIHQMVQVLHPPAGAFLLPIAQAGKQLKSQIQELQQRATGGQPSAVGTVPPTPPNPAEGVSPRPV